MGRRDSVTRTGRPPVTVPASLCGAQVRDHQPSPHSRRIHPLIFACNPSVSCFRPSRVTWDLPNIASEAALSPWVFRYASPNQSQAWRVAFATTLAKKLPIRELTAYVRNNRYGATPQRRSQSLVTRSSQTLLRLHDRPSAEDLQSTAAEGLSDRDLCAMLPCPDSGLKGLPCRTPHLVSLFSR